ncbi:radical SAM family heme chaperone HemW [Pareuzebyella sediminis]|uniref:radical SAM family heme chaperone HemW n=1 Tax=Pareuzebyella sediminis TaxID=2607998 RepID=UPI0011F04047|nr:radical SAM family heme chaperone HemW [Pareuzebyella sediminis]
MSGIYIHIPFCKQACHYCDFHFSTSMGKKETMIAALIKELELRRDEAADKEIETIYFGGGTPSVLRIDELNGLIEAVYANYRVASNPEITLEANPDDLSRSKLIALSESKLNRLSIGIQSFDDKDLKLMNRAHSAAEAERSLALATRYFENISIDLIYGIPGMSVEQWEANIAKALSFDIPHISSYALTVEPKTALANFIKKGLINNVDDEQSQVHFYKLCDTLEENGFENYEISNFARPGFYSKNNTAYWQQKRYIGIGPSAHSFDGIRRSWNVSNNPKYIKAIEKEVLPMETEVLSIRDRYNEYVMTGLRTVWGVSFSKVEADFGGKYKDYLQKQAERYLKEGLLHGQDNKLFTTKKGRFLADGIASDLFMVNLG